MLERAGVSILLLLATSSLAQAQVCAGASSYRSGMVQAGAGISFTEAVQGLTGQVGVGRQWAFGTVGFTLGKIDAINASVKAVTLGVGVDTPLGREQGVFFCPGVNVIFSFGPDFGRVDVSGLTVTGGGQVGIVAADMPNIDIVPTLGLGAAYSRLRAEFEGRHESESQTHGFASIGLGLLFRDRQLALTPSLSIPFGISESDVQFTLAFTASFGR